MYGEEAENAFFQTNDTQKLQSQNSSKTDEKTYLDSEKRHHDHLHPTGLGGQAAGMYFEGTVRTGGRYDLLRE